jgi:hypothetical protein
VQPDFTQSGRVPHSNVAFCATLGWDSTVAPGAPHIRVVCECVGAASAESLAAYGKAGAESICTRRIISDPEIFRRRTNPRIAKYAMHGAPGPPSETEAAPPALPSRQDASAPLELAVV